MIRSCVYSLRSALGLLFPFFDRSTKAERMPLFERLNTLIRTQLRSTIQHGADRSEPSVNSQEAPDAEAPDPNGPGPDACRAAEAGRAFADPDFDVELMPLRALLRSERKGMPVNLRASMDRFENRLVRDARLQATLAECEEKISEAAMVQESVLAHMERVTGHRVEDMPSFTVRRQLSRPGTRYRPSRPPVARMQARSAVLACVMLIFVATWGSYRSDPLSHAIAQAVASESVLFGSLGETSRGQPDPELEARRERIRTALSRIDEARTSVLGFHTGYEPMALRDAARLVDQAARSLSPVEPTSAELYRLRDEIISMIEPGDEVISGTTDQAGH